MLNRPTEVPAQRGCVFFNFGARCALRLLVAVSSLRTHYHGPLTVFLVPDRSSSALARDLEALKVDVTFMEGLSKSFDRHRLFETSPYPTTLMLDSDLLFTGSIDPLWDEIEREGVLFTRFYPSPYGVDGTEAAPGFGNRIAHLSDLKPIIDPELFEQAKRRMLEDRIDINAGVMGIARPKGDAFLSEWSHLMEKGRGRSIYLLDEISVVALSAKHPHYLADEIWNCPADEYFRRTNLADARIIHYFAEGARVYSNPLGRNPHTWAGRKWLEACVEAQSHIDLREWIKCDPDFPRVIPREFAERLPIGSWKRLSAVTRLGSRGRG